MQNARAQLAAALLFATVTLTGCQVVSESQYAQVRVIEVSPDAPTVDLYQNSDPILYGIPPGTASSYIPVPAGTYTYSLDIAGMRQQLASASRSLAAGAQYTVLVGDTTASLQMTLLKDQAIPAPANQAALRIVHQGTRAGVVDVYLVPAGGKLSSTAPFATNVSFGRSPAYLNAPAGTYSVVALPAGTPASGSPTALYSGIQAEYSAGSAHTIVFYDHSAHTSELQALITDDFVPAS